MEQVTRQRVTRQRLLIDALVSKLSDFHSAQEIHAILQGEGSSVGIATVYRNLQSLADQGRLDVMRSESGEILYRHCRAQAHHHHLVCERCGEVRAFEDRELERAIEQLSSRVDYAIDAHDVTLRGECPDCRASG